MKKILIVIFIFTSNYLIAQSFKGILVLRYKSTIGDEKVLNEKEKSPIIYSYIFSKNKSVQKLISSDKTSTDTTYVEKMGLKLPTKNTFISQSSQIFYKDFENDIYKSVSTTQNVDLSIKDKLLKFKWSIESEKKIISGYNCIKATTLNKSQGFEIPITAWFTEEILVNDGPTYYTGLPGFIIQVEVGTFSIFTFENLIFEKKITEIEEPFNSAKNLTLKEYTTLKSNEN